MDAAKANSSADPRRYFEGVRTDSDRPAHDPVCLYLETTNRCNLLCTTCPRTYEELEPPADMSWQLFCSIVDQIPNLARAVLHGVGEPMLVKNLPRMVRYLMDRGTYVLFNTNGTVLNEKNGRALIEAGLDELRVSFDAANAESYKAIRGKNYFNRILRNVRAFRELQERESCSRPRVSAWLTGLRETVEQLPEFVRVAAEAGVREVYLQRLVFFEENAIGKARADQALYEQLSREDARHIDRATDIAASLGISFSASGAASEPGMSLKRSDSSSHGRCAVARGPSCTSLRMAARCRAASRRSRCVVTRTTRSAMRRQTLRQIWQGPAYQEFRRALKSDKPPATCANCGLRWSL
jgi:MoaA/NifB/PqqE/SkfB family radical SAM enzyme